jgi:hypothetical protein
MSTLATRERRHKHGPVTRGMRVRAA